jgi:hypothetical protein
MVECRLVSAGSRLAAAAMDGLASKTAQIPWRGVLALLGGFLIQLSLGSFYSFGNMMTYLTSYMRYVYFLVIYILSRLYLQAPRVS